MATELSTCFTALRLRTSTRAWIDRIEGSTEKGLAKMASLSDEAALRTLRTYFFIVSVLAFIAFIAAKDVASPGTKQVLAFAIVVPFFFTGSMGAWANNRDKILKDLLIGLKIRVVRGLLWGGIAICTLAVLFCLVTPVNWSEGENWVSLVGVVVGLTLCVGVGMALGEGLTTGIIYGPAILTLLYIRLTIVASRFFLRFGRWLYNGLVIYGVVATIYMNLLSNPRLAKFWGIGSLC
nr:hypothetical protein [Herbaspirillum sp. B39]